MTIPDLARHFGIPVGLSDHTLGTDVAVAAVSLGASAIEKHFTMSRSEPGPDSAFSLEPEEFAALVRSSRTAWAALGCIRYGPTENEEGQSDVPPIALHREGHGGRRGVHVGEPAFRFGRASGWRPRSIRTFWVGVPAGR